MVVLGFIFYPSEVISILNGLLNSIISPAIAILDGIYNLGVDLIHGIINSFGNAGTYVYKNTIGRL